MTGFPVLHHLLESAQAISILLVSISSDFFFISDIVLRLEIAFSPFCVCVCVFFFVCVCVRFSLCVCVCVFLFISAVFIVFISQFRFSFCFLMHSSAPLNLWAYL